MLKAVSLFSGCGGSDAGLVKNGIDVVMANDILPYARDVYLANLPETDYLLTDIRDVKSFPMADLLVGCYPCQGFSQGGARKVDRSINYLYKEFARALSLIKPKVFVVENVSGMRTSTFKHLLNDQLDIFSKSTETGYNVVWKEVKANEFGVPQERKRLIIVGFRNDLNMKYSFPDPTHGPTTENEYLTIRSALQGLPDWPEGEYCEDIFHWYYLSRNRRCDWNDVSKTIVSNMRHIPLHPVSPKLIKIGPDQWRFETEQPARRFSFREAARLQGFTKDYTQHGRDLLFPDNDKLSRISLLKERYKVVGNAVPPPLFDAIIANIPKEVW